MLRRVWTQARRAIQGDGAPRVLIASNRLPITAVKDGTSIRFRQSDGGLASGLRQVARSWPVRWYGWRGLASEMHGVQSIEAPESESLVAISLNAEEIAGYYTQFSNSVLWPALHDLYLADPPSPNAWHRYVDVNARFADAIRTDLRANDRVWIHDYHLFLLPRLLRRRASDDRLPITFFLHTPFPPADKLEAIPQYRALLEGVLGADVIGFHTQEYATHFLEAARGCGYDAGSDYVLTPRRRVAIRVRPMGIDAETFARLGSDPAVLREVIRMRSLQKTILLGVDRLDYTKGIPERMLAFEALLEHRPQLREKICLVQVAVPSRTDVAAYIDLRAQVESIIERINTRFTTATWQPVDYRYGSVDLCTLAALYRAADVMVVTPFRDGLNLVAKEFVATRVDGDGVLILSKFAGAAAELHAALKCDPSRIRELAQTYYRALTMPLEERRRRMSEMVRAVSHNGITNWISYFVGQPEAARVIPT